MWIFILIGAIAICTFKWAKWKVACAALIFYMEVNQYKLPNEAEMKECTDYATKHMIQDFFR